MAKHPTSKTDPKPPEEVSDAAAAAMAAEKAEADAAKKAKVEEDEAEKKAKEEDEAPKEVVLKKGEELFHVNLHPTYKPYFKQLLTGVPRQTVNAVMTRKFLDPTLLDTPKARIVYRSKAAHKKTALDVLAEEEARQAIKAEDKEIAANKSIENPMENIDWNKPEFKGFVGFFRKIKVYAEEKKKQMELNAFKYGPPYSEDYGGSILEECNKPQPGTLDIHQMLLEGADPRVSEEADFRNTSLHYACRYVHFRIAKMLFKAKCEIDVTNELGITPLGTLCMFNPPEPRHRLHLKFATFLLDNDAEVNHVDKGGHTCLEFAAKHGNLGLCALLLRFGARVKRDAEFISLSTVNLLDPEVCEDMTCRQLLRTKYNEEVRIEEEEKDRLRKIREDKEQAERDAERRRAIEWARLNKANAHLERELYEEHLRIEDMKMKKREEAMKRRLQILEEKKNENGTWKKFDAYDWRFVEGKKTKNISIHGSVYDEAKNLNGVIKENHGHTIMNKRWKEITGRELLTVGGLTDMGYGIDDISKEQREREEEEERLGLNVMESSDEDEDVNVVVGEEDGLGKVGEDGEEGDWGGGGGFRRRMSITGARLVIPKLPKIGI